MTVFVRHPVDNPSISQEFGDVGWRIHHGVDYRPDYPGQVGKVIYAPADMFIVWARGEQFAAGNPWDQMPNNGNNGNSIIASHPAPHQAVCSLYAHMDQIWVEEGQFVTAGTPLGTMGWTGYILPKDQNGTHLHWEMFIDYADGVYPEGTFYGRVNPLDYFQTATVTPVAPGAAGGSAVSKPGPTTPAPKPKEWYEMPIPAEDLKKIHDAIWHGVPGAKLINNRETKKGEWAETTLGSLTDRIVRQQIAPMRQEVAASNAQIKGLVGAIAALSKGEPFDEAKLLAGVQAAAKEGAREGVAETIDSIDVTVNTKGEAA